MIYNVLIFFRKATQITNANYIVAGRKVKNLLNIKILML